MPALHHDHARNATARVADNAALRITVGQPEEWHGLSVAFPTAHSDTARSSAPPDQELCHTAPGMETAGTAYLAGTQTVVVLPMGEPAGRFPCD
jgi:hypothetical protein